jgi:hypothetical protein
MNDEPILENLLTVMIKEILDDPCLDEMAKRLETQPVPLYGEIDNDEPPGISYLSKDLPKEEDKLLNLFEANMREVNSCEELELKRKMLFLDEDSVRFQESILDNTVFNIIQEATHSECDLMKAPRTYISKKP